MEYELYHHGILGMKWGIRRYQNPDGSLTPAGRRRLQQNAARVEKTRREYERAGLFKRGKAREKYDRARDRYDKFASKLEYNKMTDEQFLAKTKDFMKNQSLTMVVNSQNVKAGKYGLEDKIKLYNTVVSAATSTVNLINTARQAYTNSKIAKQTININERKQRIAESEEARAQQKYLDNKNNELRDYKDKRSDALRDYNDKRSDALRDYNDKRADAAKNDKQAAEIANLGKALSALKAENSRLEGINKTQLEVNSDFRTKNKSLESKIDQMITSISDRDVSAMRIEADYKRLSNALHAANVKLSDLDTKAGQNELLESMRKQWNKK